MNHSLHSHAPLVAALLVIGLMLTACGQDNLTDRPETDAGNIVPIETTVIPETTPEVTMAEHPVTGTYNPNGETIITLDDNAPTPIEVAGEGAIVEQHTVTITKAGSYLINGTLSDGQIVVDTADEEKVTLLLNGVALTCTDGPAVYVKQCPKKVIIETVEGSVNILSDGTNYVVPDEEQEEGEIYPNACIYACEDLTFDGHGTLYIKGNADKGINTKDDLEIKGGTVVVTSVGVGMRGNDSVTVGGGEITVVSGSDGIKSANIEKEGKGTVSVAGGTLYITATGDGLSAATDMTVTGGTLVITTKDIENGNGQATMATSDHLTITTLRGPGGMPPGGGNMMPPGGGGMGGMTGEGNHGKASISAKGLKAVGTLTINGGKLTINAADDGIHADDTVFIQGGQMHISSADDGIHADKVLTVSGGVTEVAKSYEGLEANQLTINGGTNRIHATDDGVNANGGSGMGRPGGWFGSSNDTTADSDTVTTTPLLTISGGYTVLYADGDGVDSNGNIVMSNGTVLVYGPTNNGNGPIDHGDGNYSMTVSGGTFLAVGSSGMADSAHNNGQAVLNATRLRSSVAAGSLIGIKDADGNIVAAFELPKTISSVVFSAPALVAGKTYTIVSGGESGEVVDGMVTESSSYTGYIDVMTVTAS